MPTALWEVHDRLFTLWSSATTATVLPGPVAGKSTMPKTCVMVGTDGGDTGDGDGSEDGSTFQQDPALMGPGTWREERGAVVSAIWAWDGSTDLAPLRATVTDVFDDLERALHADRSLGGLFTPPNTAGLSALRVRATQEKYGALIRATFTVSYSALIIS